ncbi:MAG: HNH endonuclease [Myxococcota bacterium]
MQFDASLSNAELLARMPLLAHCERGATAEVIEHLMEIDRRKLYLGQACSSLSAYCRERLDYSEDEAGKRVRVARLARDMPQVLDELRAGRIHLTGLFLLAPHMTRDNADQLLHAARGKSRREIERLLAALFPRPDVKESVTPIITPTDAKCADRLKPLSASTVLVQFTASNELYAKIERARELLSHSVPGGALAAVLERAVDELIHHEEKRRLGADPPQRSPSETGAERKRPSEADPPQRSPSETSAERKRPSEADPPQKRRSETSAERKRPSEADPPQGYPSQTSAERKRLSETDPPQKRRSETSAGQKRLSEADPPQKRRSETSAGQKRRDLKEGSRYVPVEVARAVWRRDGAQCSFVDSEGRRCGERRFITIEHKVPFARGGAPTLENLCLLCSPHNAYTAELAFGAEHIERKKQESRRRQMREHERERDPKREQEHERERDPKRDREHEQEQKRVRSAEAKQRSSAKESSSVKQTSAISEAKQRQADSRARVLSALCAMGFGRREAARALGQLDDDDRDLSLLLRRALARLVPDTMSAYRV